MGNFVRIAVGIAEGNHRNTELMGFADGDVLALGVDNEHGAWKALHVLDSTQRAVHFGKLASQIEGFLLGQRLEPAVVPCLLKLDQAVNRALNGLEVCEGSAKPAVVHKVHSRTLGLG